MEKPSGTIPMGNNLVKESEINDDYFYQQKYLSSFNKPKTDQVFMELSRRYKN